MSDLTYLRSPLTNFAIPKSSTFNLLKEETKRPLIRPVTHFRTKYSIMICTEDFKIPKSNIPNEIIALLRINSAQQFLPMLIQDLFQTRLRDLEQITTETNTFTLSYAYTPATIGKMKFLMQMEMTFKQFLSLGFTEKDVDELKGVFADTNVYLLCATLFIGSVHVKNIIHPV